MELLDNPAIVLRERGDIGREVGLSPGQVRELLQAWPIDARAEPDRVDRGIDLLGARNNLIPRCRAAWPFRLRILIAAVGDDNDDAPALNGLEAAQCEVEGVVQRRSALCLVPIASRRTTRSTGTRQRAERRCTTPST